MLKFSKLARSHTQCLYFVIILSIQRYAISNKRELHCVRADVFGDLKIYVSEALARFARSRIKISYFFSVGTFGGLAPPPPPNTKKLATLVAPTLRYYRFQAKGLCNCVKCLKSS